MERTRLNKPAALRRLRDNLDELEVYVTRIAEHTGIPAAHLEKDFWVTEVLRGAAAASASTGCSVIFKGGTSLSKAHRLIQRFSEDIDLIVVMPQGGKSSKDTTLKNFAAAAATATGITPAIDRSSATTGVKRTAVFDRLLRDEATLHDLEIQSIDVLAREVTRHSQAAGLPTADRPVDGFASSPAWNPNTAAAKEGYDTALRQLVWSGAPRSTFEECCRLTHNLRDKL